MSTPNTYIGIDPGIARLGWGIVTSQNGNLVPEAYGVIETHSKTPHPERLIELHLELQSIIHDYSPTIASVEKLFFGKNVKTAMVVGEARGLTLLTLALHNIPIEEFTPNEIKIAITGYGGADKIQVQKMVQQTLKLKHIPAPDDAADALAVAIAAASTLHLP